MLTLCGLFTSRSAGAQCVVAQLVDTPHPKQWDADIAALSQELAQIEASVCRPIVVRIDIAAGRPAILSVETADHRRATRPVARPDALVPIALGVLASLPDPVNDVGEVVPAKDASARAAVDGDGLARDESPARDDSRDGRHGGDKLRERDDAVVEGRRVSAFAAVLSTGTRIGFPASIVMLDLELAGEATLARNTFLTVHGRYVPLGAPLGTALDDDNYGEYALGAGVGRSFPVNGSVWKVAFEPELALISMETDAVVGGERGGSATQLRLLLTGGWSSRRVGPFRFVALADGGVAPYALAHATRLADGLAALPAWTLGLRFGASFEGR